MFALLACVALVSLVVLCWIRQGTQRRASVGTPPGPQPLPIIGSLHLLGGHESPFAAFTALSKVYGDVFSITLGSTACVVVNSFSRIKEVLIAKGADFGGRPDFIRFHKLFGGDRNNSLALCDWSALQKTRRSIARTYCSPRFTTLQYDHVNAVGCAEVDAFLGELPTGGATVVELKPLVLAACANMFTQYMCSTRFAYDDDHFTHVVRTFDEIFWEINQGYAVDFLPWLLPAYHRHMRKLSAWAADVRHFILSRIIDERRLALDTTLPPRDFTDALLLHLVEGDAIQQQQQFDAMREQRPTPPLENLNWQHIIFELEDFLGGHSAIGNLVMITLAAIVRNDGVAGNIQAEVDRVTGGVRLPTLHDKPAMPYTEATIWEALRTASSPIVPHVATVDTHVDGFRIARGTVLFVNNYELNVGADYWTQPHLFRPERFLNAAGHVVKPAHFIPFSTGKRTCIGQRLVQCFSFLLIAALFQRYDVSPDGPIRLQPSCVAVPPDAFTLRLTPRCRDARAEVSVG